MLYTDTEILDWLLPMLNLSNEETSNEGDAKAMIIAQIIYHQKLEGREAICKAMDLYNARNTP